MIDPVDEAAVERAMVDVFAALRRRVVPGLQAASTPGAALDVVRAIPGEWIRQYVAMADLVSDVIVSEAVAVVLASAAAVVAAASDLAVGYSLQQYDPEVEAALSSHLATLQEMGANVGSGVQTWLTNGLREGKSVDHMAAEMAEAGPLSERSARTWARSEANAASNAGSHSMYTAAGVPYKRWDSAHDDRVRESHRVADGQVRRVNEPFDVGGYPAQHPGDVQLPMDQRLGCRCTIVPLFEGDVELEPLSTGEQVAAEADRLGVMRARRRRRSSSTCWRRRAICATKR